MSAAVREINVEKCAQMGLLPGHGRFAAPPVDGVESRHYARCKRVLDVAGALLGLAVLLLPMCGIALLIVCSSGMPVLFRQERLGENGIPFTLYKFRTMHPDAERDGAQWAEAQDVRVTAIGRLLRASHLDELPQLINVLRGEMSLVGPRPERACFYRLFDGYIDGFRNRLCVPPGLTGWAQVHNAAVLPQEKIVYDMEYINHRSLWLDFRCIALTLKVVVSGDAT